MVQRVDASASRKIRLTGAVSRDASRTSAARRKRKCRKMRRGHDRALGKVGRRRRNPPGRLIPLSWIASGNRTPAPVYIRPVKSGPPLRSLYQKIQPRRGDGRILSPATTRREFFSRGGNSTLSSRANPSAQLDQISRLRPRIVLPEAGNERDLSRKNLGYSRFDLISRVFSFVGNFAETCYCY